MHYIENTLLADEHIILATRPHWIVFASATFAFLLALLVLWYGPEYTISGIKIFSMQIYQVAALSVFVVGIFLLLRAYIDYETSEYGVTDKRILMKIGWIQRTSLEIFLGKVEAVLVDQTIPGRVLNYGTIIIVGTGGTRDPFYNVPDPLSFRKRVQEQIDVTRS